jgi:hypothetical protein
MTRGFPRLSTIGLAVLSAVVVGSVARADVTATFDGTNPSQTVTATSFTTTYTSVPVGPFNFSNVSAGGAPLGDTFRAFCADFFQDVSPGNTYTFQSGDMTVATDVGSDATKTARIQKLFDNHYAGATDADTGGAFQLALWELTYDGAGASLDLTGGNFTASGSASSLTIAQNWLNGLDAAPTTNAYQIVGLYSADYQDQLTVAVTPVPAPAGVVLAAVAGGVMLLRRRMTARKAESAEATA